MTQSLLIPPAPPQAAIAAAIDRGVAMRGGWPVCVEWEEDGVEYRAVPNLVMHGGHDPWVVTAVRGTVYSAAAYGASVMAIEGMEISPADQPHVLRAIEMMPDEADRHDETADGLRLAAGQAAMEIRDAMVRARVLDHVDGWEAYEAACDLIEEDPAHGRLLAFRGDGGDVEIKARLLLVVCPSTGRRYAHLVPPEHGTAQSAREWIMGGPVDVES